MSSSFESLTQGIEIDGGDFALTMRSVVPADRKYVILFTPRSGSTWLTSLLSGVRELGFPEEYLNPAFIPAVAKSLNCVAQGGYFPMLLRKCKTDNGVFGMKVRSTDIRSFGEREFLDGIGGEATYFYLWRDNVVAQGISLYRAVTTGRFHSSEREGTTAPPYDREQIAYWINHIIEIENGNLRLLQNYRLNASFLCYEEITRSARTAVKVFLDIILGDVTHERCITGEMLSQMSDDWNSACERSFREEAGDFLAGIENMRLIRTATR